MNFHYRITDPADVRDLGDLPATWAETGNPKADDWAEQPPQPTPDAIWQDGAWVIPPPPEPTPDWPTFKAVARSPPALKAAILAAWPKEPQAAMALSATLLQAEQGATADFRGCWRAVCAAAPVAPETVAEVVALAEKCQLPAEFVAALQPLERTRDGQGRFVADDPATPQDVAWISPE
jgi:hypothetical protein